MRLIGTDHVTLPLMPLTLTRLDPEGADRGALIDFFTGNEFPFHMTTRPTPAQVEAWIADGAFRSEDNDSFWLDDDELGRVGFFRLEEITDQAPVFDLRLDGRFRGRGLGVAAVRAATDHVFRTYPEVRRFEGQTREDNLSMRRVFLRCGWVKEAHYRQGWPVEGHEPLASVAYAVLRRDWEATRRPQGEEGVRHAYDTLARDYALRLPDTQAEDALDLAMIDRFVELVREDGPVLDAGCGAGRMTRYLADRGCMAQGVDLSPGMVEQARLAHPDLTFSTGSLSGMPFADAQFAGALVWYSTIHLTDQELPAALAEIVRVVRPGGYLLVGFQAGTGTQDLAAAYQQGGHQVELERYRRTPDQLSTLLEDAGATEVARMVRRAMTHHEVDDQAVLLARRSG